MSEDWSKDIAFMINFFPFQGRPENRVTCRADRYPGGCAIGFQLGHSLDARDPLDRWYAGLLVEPIAGLGLSVGATLINGEFAAANQQEGMLLANGSAPSIENKVMVRPYLGVTLTLDVVKTVQTAFTAQQQTVGK